MLLEHLSLVDVRNYTSLEFEPVAGLNVLAGANAQGKSNLLEAIGILGTGRSFRTARDREVVSEGASEATIAGRARTAAGTLLLACQIQRGPAGTRKRYTVNGAGVRYAGYLGRARVVTFIPQDLELIVGSPGRRRALLNSALAQERPGYYIALSRYTKFLEQKRALLRGQAPADRGLLDVYDERLIDAGCELIAARRAYLGELAVHALSAYDAWADDGPLEIAYEPNVDLGPDLVADPRAALGAHLAALRNAELARRTALGGPHRDDFSVRLAGRPMDAYGSQGQQRSAVLAIKIAEYRTSGERSGEPPLLLLDDVLSELDPARQVSFLDAIAGVEQAFVTTTHEPERIAPAAIYRVVRAALERVA